MPQSPWSCVVTPENMGLCKKALVMGSVVGAEISIGSSRYSISSKCHEKGLFQHC